MKPASKRLLISLALGTVLFVSWCLAIVALSYDFRPEGPDSTIAMALAAPLEWWMSTAGPPFVKLFPFLREPDGSLFLPASMLILGCLPFIAFLSAASFFAMNAIATSRKRQAGRQE